MAQVIEKPTCDKCGESQMEATPYGDFLYCPKCQYLVAGNIHRARESLKDKDGGENGA